MRGGQLAGDCRSQPAAFGDESFSALGCDDRSSSLPFHEPVVVSRGQFGNVVSSPDRAFERRHAGRVTQRNAIHLILSAAVWTSLLSAARANSTCSSVLTADQLHALDGIVFPAYPYSAHLGEAIDADAAQGAVKRLTRTDIEKLRGAITHPFVGPVRELRSQEDIAALKAWLSANSSGKLPAWDTAAAESDWPSAWVPRAWIGRTADDYVHLVTESGNVGPITAGTLGGATTRGRIIGITQHIAADSSGRDMFLWSYIYRATVGGQLITTLLAVCRADVVMMSDDEHELRALEQQLARAWATRDRSTLERILAREWSVTMPDGATVSRAAVLGVTFDSTAQIIEAVTTDEDSLTVTRFDSAAIVRGRTIVTVASADTRQTNAVRFTDVFVKRDGSWQLVASHQSRSPE